MSTQLNEDNLSKKMECKEIPIHKRADWLPTPSQVTSGDGERGLIITLSTVKSLIHFPAFESLSELVSISK